MTSSKRGSVFLLTLTLLTVIFIMGFAFTFFTGSEDYSSSMSYESEVAFSLAESAIEEFVARLKNSLNHDDSNNQLYKVLRAHDLDVSKDITLDANQVANLTVFTREIARQTYGLRFERGLTSSNDFIINATLRLQHINPVEASSGDNVLYKIKQDLKEKQGDLIVTAIVKFKGHEAKVSLNFLIRCVKTFVPPYNYFTLFVRDASVGGNSNFNTYPSSILQNQRLRLDNGWNFVKANFDPVRDYSGSDGWEDMLSRTGEKAVTPPGRVFLGQDLNTFSNTGTSVYIRSTNGAKLLFGSNDDYDPNENVKYMMNGQDNAFLLFDVPWTGMKNYVKKYMVLQGQEKTKDGILWFTGWGNKNQVRIFNVGSGKELLESVPNGPPSFINCFKSYEAYTGTMVGQYEQGTAERLFMERMTPNLELSGFHPFGVALPTSATNYMPKSGADFSKVSPTLIYGPAVRQYFRAVQLKIDKTGEEIELPYVNDSIFNMLGIEDDKEMNATQAKMLFLNAGVPIDHVNKLIKNWNDFPEGLHEYKKYKNFMSDSGMELYNKGLAHFLNRIQDKQEEYKGKLKDYMGGYLESAPYPYGSVPSDMGTVIGQSPMREFYEGALSYALPGDLAQAFLMDFYFIPRSTEDFFRGRKTVAIGGVAYDRFFYKYVDNVQSYMSGANNQTLELNGILALNDSDDLALRNLRYRGHGIIYSSPGMMGGDIAIKGDFLSVDTPDEAALESSLGNHLITIIAPQIAINTEQAQGNRCLVEANLISVCRPLIIKGPKPITIKGTVVTPYLDLKQHLPEVDQENVIIYNPLNGIWRNQRPELMDSMYVAKIVTGGVGKFDWKYER